MPSWWMNDVGWWLDEIPSNPFCFAIVFATPLVFVAFGVMVQLMLWSSASRWSCALRPASCVLRLGVAQHCDPSINHHPHQIVGHLITHSKDAPQLLPNPESTIIDISPRRCSGCGGLVNTQHGKLLWSWWWCLDENEDRLAGMRTFAINNLTVFTNYHFILSKSVTSMHVNANFWKVPYLLVCHLLLLLPFVQTWQKNCIAYSLLKN